MPVIKIVELNGEVVFRPDDPRERSGDRSTVGERAMRGSQGALNVRAVIGWCCVTVIAMALLDGARAEELAPLSVCSASTAGSGGDICSVTMRPDGRRQIKINLTAQTGKISVGGYSVETHHYNDSYLAPVVEAMPGDVVAARLVNRLSKPAGQPGAQGGHVGHGPVDEIPTNLHYFHGGIVTPNNARPKDARDGNGDNIYVHLKNGLSFEYEVPIPGPNPKELDARVLEGAEGTYIEHPSGLNWYHSHLHGRSSAQVMGGLSGLLSIGDPKINVVACRRDPTDQRKCLNDPQGTDYLRARTDVRYAVLRDIALNNISALPEAAGDKTATWAPDDKDWKIANKGVCPVWLTEAGPPEPDPSFRKGYCQRDARTKAWLFTLNGQRFPTITVAGGKNLLLRMGNLSPNVAYWLELVNERDENDKLNLSLLSVDGVVPAKPVDETAASQPVRAVPVRELVFMPASRAEIYVRNDDKRRDAPTVYILRTKGLIAGSESSDTADQWPQIQLARIVLEPTVVTSQVEVALNAPVAKARQLIAPQGALLPPKLPDGCIADIDPTMGEHRRVTFFDEGLMSNGSKRPWGILTEIVRPPAGTSAANPAYEEQFDPVPEKTIGIVDPHDPSAMRAIAFEDYDLGDGAIDWSANRKRVCIHIDSSDPSHRGSHKQLWVLYNSSTVLHNFHIHQMNFRLATADELKNDHKIMLDDNVPAETCPDDNCGQPNYKLYDVRSAREEIKWHDTIPMPPLQRVFIVMSFDASQQIGRYVFHCHILKHEDDGLMAPIEVWRQ
jgi:FtsP/CotA-like multicopper oxidase with cupredoxin domain